MPFIQIRKKLSKFSRCEDGSIAIEAMIILPIMFWTFLVCFSIFDTFRMYNINYRATSTISDAVSRETANLDSAYLTATHDLFEYLSLSPGNTSIRISALRFNANENEFVADWSEGRGGRSGLTAGQVQGLDERLPTLVHNEVVVLVETWTDYQPPFRTGFEQREIRNFAYTSLRAAPNICYQSQCGTVIPEDEEDV